MDESKRGYLPMRQDIHLSKKISPKTPEKKNRISSIPYASTVWSIIYTMLYPRPDIAYTLGIASRF